MPMVTSADVLTHMPEHTRSLVRCTRQEMRALEIKAPAQLSHDAAAEQDTC